MLILQQKPLDPLSEKTAPLSGKDFLYKRITLQFTAQNTLPKSDFYTAEVSFNDDFHGFAYLSLCGVSPLKVAGYTACKTNRKRSCAAVFSFKDSVLPKEICLSITGFSKVESVCIYSGENTEIFEKARSLRAKPDEIIPEFTLKNNLQLVTTVGDHSFAASRTELANVLERMEDEVPYARAIGFNGAESYVRWNLVEDKKGVFDWSYYDSVIASFSRFGMKWFPLIIGGSAYALPEWYREETDGFVGFRCLEHDEGNNIPTVFNEQQTPFIVKYLHELGKHYNDNPHVFGVRLGPSGNYGESQYPASGNWGYKGQKEHMHLGYWANDRDAHTHFAAWLGKKYNNLAALNEAWGENYSDFREIRTFLPSSTENKRKRKDFADWYMFAMTDWCNRWAVWTREELKKPDIYQSSGGWGFLECGTDFTDQTRGMIPVNGGIRATNEDESYELNFAITRMLSSSARFYKIPFGSEPAGYGTARSVINRLFNIIVNNGAHLFYYGGNFQGCDESAIQWLKYAPLLEQRAEPLIDVAVIYPDSQVKLTDASIRYLEGSGFFSQVFSLRRRLDYDFCAEQMILDGALEKSGYKAIVYLGKSHECDYIEKEAYEKLDEWIQGGGTLIYPVLRSNARQGLYTIEGDNSIFRKWQAGETGKGRVHLVNTMREPLDEYINYACEILTQTEGMNSLTLEMLKIKKPLGVYVSALKTGKLVVYNDLQKDAIIELSNGRKITLEPVSINII